MKPASSPVSAPAGAVVGFGGFASLLGSSDEPAYLDSYDDKAASAAEVLPRWRSD